MKRHDTSASPVQVANAASVDSAPSLFHPHVKQRAPGRRFPHPSKQTSDTAYQGKGFIDLPLTPPILPMRIMDTVSIDELSDLVASEGRTWKAKELAAAVRRFVYFHQKRPSGGSGRAGHVWTGTATAGSSTGKGDALSVVGGSAEETGGPKVVQLARGGATKRSPGAEKVQMRATDAQLLGQLVLLLRPKMHVSGRVLKKVKKSKCFAAGSASQQCIFGVVDFSIGSFRTLFG